MKYKFTFLDLFSGIGGFRIALERLGGKCLGFSEIDNDAILTYKLNYIKENDQEKELGDITKLTKLPKVDVLVGGVPCQSWSVAGKKRGFNDPRGKLWYDSIRLVELNRPKIFIFENVKGLYDPRNKANLDLILDSFKKLDYIVFYKLLNSYDFGLPQNRERIFIVGFNNKYKKIKKFEFPKSIDRKPKLYEFLDNVEKNKVIKNKFNPNQIHGDRIPASRNRFQKVDELNDFFIFCDTRDGHTTIHSWDLVDTSEKEKKICRFIMKNRRKKIFGPYDGNPIPLKIIKSFDKSVHKKDIDNLVNKKILRKVSSEGYDFSNSKNSSGINGIYRVFLPNSDVFSTLTATGTRDYIAIKNIYGNSVEEYKKNFIKDIYQKNNMRQITPREASRLQGFGDKFICNPVNKIAHKQFGNAVSVNAVYNLFQKILKTNFL